MKFWDKDDHILTKDEFLAARDLELLVCGEAFIEKMDDGYKLLETSKIRMVVR